MKQLKKTILTLVALLALTTQAWAKWNGGTYTATDNEKIYITVNVTDDATLTINQGFTVTTESITISAGKTLTVVGPGSLVVKGGITGSGTIIVKGNASLLVYGAEGSDGASGDNGSDGGDGAAAIMCSITIYSGSILAYGGDGGKGGDGDLMSGSGGDGGNAGPAFGGSGTLTYYGGSIEAFRGSLGAGGEGASYGEFGEDATAFADTYNVIFENQPTSIQDAYDNPIDINDIKGVGDIKILGDDADAVTGPTGPEVAWDKTSKTGTFTMPGGNVTLEPEYYPQATADGAVTAATDAKATTDAPLVTVDATQLTGAAKMMYYASTSTTAPDYDAEGWSDKVPTAEKFTEAGNVNVWYYPVGTDEGVGGATATYSDGDMNATALAVTIAAEPTYAVTFADGVNPEPPADPEWTATPNTDVKKGQTVTVTYTGTRKVIGVKAEKKAVGPTYPVALSAVTADYLGSVVTSDGNVYPAKTDVPAGKTAVGIVGKVTSTGHGLILALKDATSQKWNTINGWTSVTTYAGTTLKQLPAGALGSLTSYTTLGETAVSNWAVAQMSDYDAIFKNLGSKVGDESGMTYDGNVNAYLTTGVGGTEISGDYWSATEIDDESNNAGYFDSECWYGGKMKTTYRVRPVLGF